MTLEQLLEMWKTDSEIDRYKLDETSLNTPKLHSKYLEILSIAKLQRKKAEHSQKRLLKKKWLYYNGKLPKDAIEELGWEYDPFQGLKVLKGEMEYYYNSDIDIQKSEEKCEYHKVFVETATEIVTNLNWRHQTVGNIIRWRQFEAGG